MNKVRKKKEKKNTLVLVILLLSLMLGIGYAALNELLTINTSVKYDTINWEVGFKSVQDGGGTVSSNPSISDDKKTITLACNVGMSTEANTCIATAQIQNNSTFKIKLSEDPTIEKNDTYIESVTAVWTSDSSEIKKDDTMAINETKEMKITIQTKELSKDLLPESSLEIPVKFTMNWVESTDETTEPETGGDTTEEPETGESTGTTIINLFDPNDEGIEAGGIYHSDNGGWIASGAYSSTGYIPIEAGKTYYIWSENNAASHVSFYLEDKTFRYGRYLTPTNNEFSITPDANVEVVYMRVGVKTDQLASLSVATQSHITE